MYNLLFDFDGTLFDTDSAHELVFQKTFTTFSLGECPPYESLKGIKTKDVFANYSDDEDMVKKLASFKSQTYQADLNSIKALVDFNLIRQLKSAGNRVFIVTGGSRLSIDLLLNMHQIAGFFDGIIAANDYTKSKPDPEPFLTCISKFNISGLTHGIEDSMQGIESLKNAGIFAVGVHNPLIAKKSDLYFPEINEYLKYLIAQG
jgi:HAD superfamily hydrolase (TIGR01509 family)